jgi:V/A-type H+-transporting ATPase subunit K
MRMEAFLPAAIMMAVSVIAAAWCLTQGSTINASAAVEKGGSSAWGVSLNLLGVLLLFYGFISGLMLMAETVNMLMIILLGVLLFLGFSLVVAIAKTKGDEKSVTEALDNLGAWGIITAIVIFLSLLFIVIGGGEGGEMIPETAWPLLMGALTMIGAGFAAALCIVSAVKAGSEMLTQRPELSIWSLLFVALGEGLAIYGLIVAILLVSA